MITSIGLPYLNVTTDTVPYFGGLKDSPTCRHNLNEVTCPSTEASLSPLKTNSNKFLKIQKEQFYAIYCNRTET